MDKTWEKLDQYAH